MAWQDEVIPADFTVESQGQNMPARDHPFFKNAPDFPTFLKSAYDNHREVNARIPLPNGTATDEDRAKWKEQHFKKLVDAKLVDAPRQLPEKYTIKRPNNLPADAWNESLEQEAYAWAKKHGLSQEALDEGFELSMKSLSGFGQAVMVNRKASVEKLKAWADEQKITVEEIDAALDRFNKDPRGWDIETAELVSKSGFADHPLVVQAIYKLMKDSGTFDVRNDGGSTVDEATAKSAREELDAIRNDPKNPMHEGFKKNDPKVTAHMESLYQKLTGGH